MDLATAEAGVLKERSALQSEEGISNPSFISEHMQRLVQYNSALEENIGKLEQKIEIREAKLFKEYRAKKMSVNAAQTQIKYDIMEEKSEITRLVRLLNSSYKLISTAQSKVKHLVEEAKSTI